MFTKLIKHQKKVFIALAIYFVMSEKDNVIYGMQSFFWPSVQSINHQIKEQEIEYSFKVGPKTYKGNRLFFGSGISNHERAAFLNSLKDQVNFPVYYSPKNPKQAVLVKGISLQSIFNTLNAFLLSLLGIIIFFLKMYVRKILYGLMLINFSLPKISGFSEELLQNGTNIFSVSKLSISSIPGLYGLKMISKSIKKISQDPAIKSFKDFFIASKDKQSEE